MKKIFGVPSEYTAIAVVALLCLLLPLVTGRCIVLAVDAFGPVFGLSVVFATAAGAGVLIGARRAWVRRP